MKATPTEAAQRSDAVHQASDPTDQDIYQAACDDWYRVLARLWPAFGKPLDETMLAIYGQELADVPLGLLERGISRVIREHKFSTVPTVAEVWSAVRRELGEPRGDILRSIDHWGDALWARVITRF